MHQTRDTMGGFAVSDRDLTGLDAVDPDGRIEQLRLKLIGEPADSSRGSLSWKGGS